MSVENITCDDLKAMVKKQLLPGLMMQECIYTMPQMGSSPTTPSMTTEKESCYGLLPITIRFHGTISQGMAHLASVFIFIPKVVTILFMKIKLTTRAMEFIFIITVTTIRSKTIRSP